MSKLYFHGTCLACRGTNKTWYGRHCPYCHGGVAFHEASDKMIIKHILENLGEKAKKELFKELAKELEDSEEGED